MKKMILILCCLFHYSAEAQNIDTKLLDAINSPQISTIGDPLFKGISSSSYVVSIAAPIAVCAAGVIKKDRTLSFKSFQMAAGLAVSMGISYGLKHAVHRARPAEQHSFIFQKTNEHSYSFPSGHTTAAFETATSLSLNFPKWYVIVPSYTWASAVAYSRLYLGVHYPSDVAAGMVIGAGSAWLSWKINQKLMKTRSKKEESKFLEK